MGITIREALITDAAQIAVLHTDSWRKHYRGIWTDIYLDNDLLSERLIYWKDKLENPSNNQKVKVAFDKNILVGFACFFIADDPVYGTLLDNLHVNTTNRGSGIGKLLLKEVAIISLGTSHEPKFYCWVLEQNLEARKFYEKMGAINKEVIPLENPDGITTSITCRYIWLDVKTTLLQQK